MKDLIDRQKLLKDIEQYHLSDGKFQHWVEVQPSVQPERHGFSVIDIKTGEEADPYEIALHEEWAKNLMYCDMEGFAIEEDGSLILVDECGRYEYCPIGRFEVRWS